MLKTTLFAKSATTKDQLLRLLSNPEKRELFSGNLAQDLAWLRADKNRSKQIAKENAEIDRRNGYKTEYAQALAAWKPFDLYAEA